MNLWQDIRFAARLLIKDRWFTLVAVLALALGIGVNATVFTFVNAVLIRGLPFNDPDRIMSIATTDARGRDRGVSYLDFVDWRRGTRAFEGLAAFDGVTMNVSDEGRPPERFAGPYISANGFAIIGQKPILGRDFQPDDDKPGAPPVVILGNGIWKNRYGSDPSVIGRTIKVNEVPSTVIGVMPEGFKFPLNADLYQPLSVMSGLLDQKRDNRGLDVFGRLAPGVSVRQAQLELQSYAATLAHDYPATNKDFTPHIMTFNERFNGGQIKLIFLALMGAVGFVLLIACANVANLLLARAAARAREMAVRVSMGATRWRIVRQLLVESVLLSILGGAVGLGIASIGIRLFDRATQDVGKPYWIQFTMDGTVIAFFAIVCLATSVVFGLAPALHASKADLNDVLKEGGRGTAGGVRARRWTGALIVIELALTLVLLSGAGFMVRSFFALYKLDLGIETSHLLTMRLALPERKYPTQDQRREFFARLDERLAGLSGVQSISITTNPPLTGGSRRLLEVEGRPAREGETKPTVTFVAVGPRYFETIGLPIVRGRTFDSVDGSAGHEAVIVNQRFVSMHFAADDPIGRRIKLPIDGPAAPNAPPPAWSRVVGIVPNVRQANLQEALPDPVVYTSLRQNGPSFAVLIIRAQGDPSALTPTIRDAVRAVDADLPLFGIQTMDQGLAQQRWAFQVFGTMFAVFALIALALSSVGLYAVTAYSVAQRTQEIGVRMALGAQAPQVWWLIVKRGLIQLALGLAIGLAGAFGVGKMLQSVLVESSRDPWTLTAIVTMLVVVSLAASFWPARRATRLDPVSALRND